MDERNDNVESNEKTTTSEVTKHDDVESDERTTFVAFEVIAFFCDFNVVLFDFDVISLIAFDFVAFLSLSMFSFFFVAFNAVVFPSISMQ